MSKHAPDILCLSAMEKKMVKRFCVLCHFFQHYSVTYCGQGQGHVQEKLEPVTVRYQLATTCCTSRVGFEPQRRETNSFKTRRLPHWKKRKRDQIPVSLCTCFGKSSRLDLLSHFQKRFSTFSFYKLIL